MSRDVMSLMLCNPREHAQICINDALSDIDESFWPNLWWIFRQELKRWMRGGWVFVLRGWFRIFEGWVVNSVKFIPPPRLSASVHVKVRLFMTQLFIIPTSFSFFAHPAKYQIHVFLLRLSSNSKSITFFSCFSLKIKKEKKTLN